MMEKPVLMMVQIREKKNLRAWLFLKERQMEYPAQYQISFGSVGFLSTFSALNLQLFLGQCQQECVAIQLLLLLCCKYCTADIGAIGNATAAVTIDQWW